MINGNHYSQIRLGKQRGLQVLLLLDGDSRVLYCAPCMYFEIYSSSRLICPPRQPEMSPRSNARSISKLRPVDLITDL